MLQNRSTKVDNSKKYESMEVDKNNFEENLPRISESIEKAEFIGKKYCIV